MKIGSTNIDKFNARQFSFVYEHMAMENTSEWTPGAAMPYFTRNNPGFMPFSVTLVVKGATREAIRANCSAILALLLEPVELTLDKFTHKFKAVMTGHSEEERSLRQYHLLKLDFNGYEFGEMVSAQNTSSISITNPGDIVSPGRVTITPSVDATSISLTGICRDSRTGTDLPVTVKNLENGKAVIIDGINGLITQEDAAREVDAWTLPTFAPGANTITCSNSFMTVKVEILPLYI